MPLLASSASASVVLPTSKQRHTQTHHSQHTWCKTCWFIWFHSDLSTSFVVSAMVFVTKSSTAPEWSNVARVHVPTLIFLLTTSPQTLKSLSRILNAQKIEFEYALKQSSNRTADYIHWCIIWLSITSSRSSTTSSSNITINWLNNLDATFITILSLSLQSHLQHINKVLKIHLWFCALSKGKGSPYSITEHRVPELIPVLGSQPAGDMSHKPGGKLPLLSTRPAVTLATLKRAATNFAAWWTEAQWV